jgi:mycothiol synthase
MATLIERTNILPAGLTARRMTLDDAEAVVALFNRYDQAILGVNGENLEDCISGWKTPGFNLAEDVLLVVDPQDQPVGYIEHWDVAEPHVRKHSYGVVDPAWNGQGIGSFLVDWLEERASATLEHAPEGTRVSLDQNLPAQAVAGLALLEQKGFTHVRTFYQMRIQMEQAPEVVIPPGLVIRPMHYPEEFPAAIQAFRDSFQDHWGFIADPWESMLARWRHFVENDPDFTPDLWFLALDGDQIAGITFNAPKTDEDPEMGWINTLGVCRPWRKHGLGLALLNYSFDAFWQRGTRKVGLGVDASSLTGATRLYERAGMRVTREYPLYEKELRAGINLATQTVGN